MNKPPISIQYSNTSDTSSALNEGRANIDLTKQASQFVARNVVIKPDALQMEVEIDGRWQTIRLAVKDNNQPTLRLNEAVVTLGENGQSLTIKSPEQTVNIKAANQLLSLLTLMKSGTPESSLTTSAHVTAGNNPQLVLDKLGLKLALDPSLAKILTQESKLIAQLQASENKIQLKLMNGFADQLFSSVLAKQKVSEQLATLGKSPLLLVDKHALQVKFSPTLKAITLPMSNLQSPPPGVGTPQWQQAQLKATTMGIQIKTLSDLQHLDLKQPIKGKFAQVSPHITPQRMPETVQSGLNLGYDKPLINITINDIKKAVEQAITQWLSKPFKQTSNSSPSAGTVSASQANTVQNAQPNQINSLPKLSATPLMLSPPQTDVLPPIVKLFAQIKSVLQSTGNTTGQNTSSLVSQQDANSGRSSTPQNANLALDKNVSATSAVAPPFSSAKMKMDQRNLITDTLKSSTQLLKTPEQSQKVTAGAHSTSLLPLPRSDYQASHPIERKLLEPLLKLVAQPAKQTASLLNSQITTEKVAQLSQYKDSQSVDMTKLVHQAFSRMIDANNISANHVMAELNSLVPGMVSQHSQTQTFMGANSFTQALDKLLVTLLASPRATSPQSLPDNIDQAQRLGALLETLVPNAKNIATKQVLPHLQQLNNTLLNDLAQVQNTLTNSVQITPTSQKVDSETQLLLSLFMPMKLPSECKQTELQIGKYKKPAKAKMPEKTVWFVRLNFDYAHLGKLSAQAELMDKALDCQLVANTQQVCALAEPHLDALRRKLCAHGLQVNEITLSEDAQQTHTFYEQHAIVNIKV
ncbi:flagellar hook-length control protein FliK [Pseudoalteromonas sp. MMG022]|uniref:flagellar hook-length control protein FliK n=1 Tax=Pseudoalteromonas sp. MMG022 TaxID=2909978 RepID=UPI001F484450|nr:flagellar hook-length control protein FliK [Pseudoalteromonas sp. MMG022]MCF6434738.1 flagellar hook-length control protein FliK [Pseudoalteromonas sp. MMG022]